MPVSEATGMWWLITKLPAFKASDIAGSIGKEKNHLYESLGGE